MSANNTLSHSVEMRRRPTILGPVLMTSGTGIVLRSPAGLAPLSQSAGGLVIGACQGPIGWHQSMRSPDESLVVMVMQFVYSLFNEASKRGTSRQTLCLLTCPLLDNEHLFYPDI